MLQECTAVTCQPGSENCHQPVAIRLVKQPPAVAVHCGASPGGTCGGRGGAFAGGICGGIGGVGARTSQSAGPAIRRSHRISTLTGPRVDGAV
eukprot:6546216-Prymnesium_polylepis.1